MNEMHLEVTKQALKEVLNIDNEPILIDESLLVLKEISQGILYEPVFNIYHSFPIPPKLISKNDLRDYVEKFVKETEAFVNPCQPHHFVLLLRKLLTAYFEHRLAQYFSTKWKSRKDFKDVIKLIEDSFRYILNIPEVIEYHGTWGSTPYGHMLFRDSRFVVTITGQEYQLDEVEIDSSKLGTGLAMLFNWGDYKTLEQALRSLLTITAFTKYKLFFNELEKNKNYADLLLN